MSKNPIGIFDSGYGGLTILKEIEKLLPQYDYLYMGDNARAPYGPLRFETVYEYTLQAVKWFFEQGCSLVILACNTASAKALRTIQQNDLPRLAPEKRVLGVIRPTAEVIGDYTTSRHVAVLGTQGTVNSGSYAIEINKFYPGITVIQEACPEWVDLVEHNEYDLPKADEAVKYHIERILAEDEQADCMLLACTHYPLLLKKIRKYTPAGINIVSQGEIIARSLAKYLLDHPAIEDRCSRGGRIRFFTTGNVQDFENHGAVFFGQDVKAKGLTL